MKKLLVLLCALALTGCAAGGEGGKNSASSSDLIEYPKEVVSTERTSPADLNVYDPWGITMTAEDVTAKGCTIVCTQSGGKDVAELLTGAAFFLEVKDGNSWNTYPTLHEHVSWTAEGWMIEKDGSVEWATEWDWLYGELPAGEYRVGKDVLNSRAPGDYDELPYYAEFTIK